MKSRDSGIDGRDPIATQVVARRSNLIRLLARGATRALAGQGNGSGGGDLQLDAPALTSTGGAAADGALAPDGSPDHRLVD